MKKILTFAIAFALVLTCGITLAACGKKNTDPVAVAWTAISANGTANVTTTTAITLTFDKNPTALAASNITVTGATKGALTGTGTTRTLAISAITVAEGATITVAISNPSGFTISPSSKTVVIHKQAATPADPETLVAPTASKIGNELHWTRITTLGAAEDYEFYVSNGTTSETISGVGEWNQSATTRNIPIGNLIAEAFDSELGNYTIKVRAVGNETTYLTSAWSNAVTYAISEPLGAPTNVTLTSANVSSKNTYTLTWDAVTNASGYTVSIGGVPYQATGTTLNLTNLALTPDVYEITVSANGTGIYSNSANSAIVKHWQETPGVVYTFEPTADAYYVDSKGTADLTGTLVIANIYFGKQVYAIGMERLKGCTELKKVILPEGLKQLGAGAFKDCDELLEINIPEGITHIWGDFNSAFIGCTNLTIYVPWESKADEPDVFKYAGDWEGDAIEIVYLGII